MTVRGRRHHRGGLGQSCLLVVARPVPTTRAPRVPRRKVASGCRQDLERQGLVVEPERIHGWPAGSTRGFNLNCFEEGRGSLVAGDPPLASPRAYPCSNGNLSARGSILDVAVREAQQKDRRRWDTGSLALQQLRWLGLLRRGYCLGFSLSRVLDSLHVDGQHVLLPATSDAPRRTQASQGVAY